MVNDSIAALVGGGVLVVVGRSLTLNNSFFGVDVDEFPGSVLVELLVGVGRSLTAADSLSTPNDVLLFWLDWCVDLDIDLTLASS